ncbi:MAG TPA: hypothetical protein VKU36_01445 [Candidatus Babeliales bacterium]|nr:hypothetical protein [Candidatus Babeliales bacterium]
MKYSIFSRIRDVVFVCALLLLVKTAFERTASFIALHKDSMIHELDRSFVDNIYTAQRQLHFLEEHPIYAHEYAHAIADIKERLSTIEEKYKKNSPGLALLGPIGSAAIVAKEEQLQQKLLETINDLSKIFVSARNALISTQNEHVPTETINHALETNKELLLTLLA